MARFRISRKSQVKEKQIDYCGKVWPTEGDDNYKLVFRVNEEQRHKEAKLLVITMSKYEFNKMNNKE